MYAACYLGRVPSSSDFYAFTPGVELSATAEACAKEGSGGLRTVKSCHLERSFRCLVQKIVGRGDGFIGQNDGLVV